MNSKQKDVKCRNCVVFHLSYIVVKYYWRLKSFEYVLLQGQTYPQAHPWSDQNKHNILNWAILTSWIWICFIVINHRACLCKCNICQKKKLQIRVYVIGTKWSYRQCCKHLLMLAIFVFGKECTPLPVNSGQ